MFSDFIRALRLETSYTRHERAASHCDKRPNVSRRAPRAKHHSRAAWAFFWHDAELRYCGQTVLNGQTF